MSIASTISAAVDFVTAGGDSDETARLARRRGIRQRLAALQIKEQHASELRQQIAALDAKADAAADKHHHATAPIQKRLTEIEKVVLQCLTDREPLDPALEAERADLLRQLHDANEVLEREITVIDSLRIKLQKQLRETNHGKTSGERQAAENELASYGIARPDLHDQYHAAGNRLQFARLRFDTARARLEKVQGVISQYEQKAREQRHSRNPENLRIEQRELHLAKVEFAAAQEEVSGANLDADRLRAEMINE